MPSVLITGGTRGIGFGLSLAFLKAGWDLTTCYHQDEESAAQAAKEFSSVSPNFLVLKKDVSIAEQAGSLVEEALSKWGGLDCVIHNAGATWNARIVNIEESQWDDTLGVHLKAAFLLAKASLRPFLKRKSGHFIFISSVVATTGNIGQGSYTAAKAGLLGFARSLAREYGGKKIRANVVCPGFHKTRLADGLSSEAEEAIRSKHWLGRSADLKEVCQFVTWLAGTNAISGQVFNLDSRPMGWL